MHPGSFPMGSEGEEHRQPSTGTRTEAAPQALSAALCWLSFISPGPGEVRDVYTAEEVELAHQVGSANLLPKGCRLPPSWPNCQVRERWIAKVCKYLTSSTIKYITFPLSLSSTKNSAKPQELPGSKKFCIWSIPSFKESARLEEKSISMHRTIITGISKLHPFGNRWVVLIVTLTESRITWGSSLLGLQKAVLVTLIEMERLPHCGCQCPLVWHPAPRRWRKRWEISYIHPSLLPGYKWCKKLQALTVLTSPLWRIIPWTVN